MQYLPNDSAIAQLFANLDTAHERAAQDTVDEIRRAQPRITGELADSYHLVSNQWASRTQLRRVFIVSSAVHANAVEWGANTREKASVRKGTKARGVYEIVDGKRKRVGYEAGPLRARASRRGPHMAGNHVVATTGPNFLEHMGFRLFEANSR